MRVIKTRGWRGPGDRGEREIGEGWVSSRVEPDAFKKTSNRMTISSRSIFA